MYLTVTTRNAITLLQELKGKSEPTNLYTVADKHELSHYFLEQIARKLREGGFVTSVRGPGGGYLLAKDRANLMEIDDLFGERRMKVSARDPLGSQVRQALAGIEVL
jgi:Rrf2 family transcriptional regulator, iron-sulfur cluster assembly transcription factor